MDVDKINAFEILTRIELEKNLIEGNDSSSQKKTVEGFAERRST